MRADDLMEKPVTGSGTEARINSIRSGLVRLLNSRRGASDATPDYGLSDFNDASVGSSDMLQVIARDIRTAIVKFEPRVTNVNVSFDREYSGGLELFFKVSVQTPIGHRNEQVMIDLVLKEGRSFALR